MCEGPINFFAILWISSTEINRLDKFIGFTLLIRSEREKCSVHLPHGTQFPRRVLGIKYQVPFFPGRGSRRDQKIKRS